MGTYDAVNITKYVFTFYLKPVIFVKSILESIEKWSIGTHPSARYELIYLSCSHVTCSPRTHGNARREQGHG